MQTLFENLPLVLLSMSVFAMSTLCALDPTDCITEGWNRKGWYQLLWVRIKIIFLNKISICISQLSLMTPVARLVM